MILLDWRRWKCYVSITQVMVMLLFCQNKDGITLSGAGSRREKPLGVWDLWLWRRCVLLLGECSVCYLKEVPKSTGMSERCCCAVPPPRRLFSWGVGGTVFAPWGMARSPHAGGMAQLFFVSSSVWRPSQRCHFASLIWGLYVSGVGMISWKMQNS